MKAKIISALFILSLLVGCTAKIESEAPEKPVPQSDASPDISIESDVSEVDTLTKDLNTDELDSIEEDLAEINW